jgi:hypothetical protein
MWHEWRLRWYRERRVCPNLRGAAVELPPGNKVPTGFNGVQGESGARLMARIQNRLSGCEAASLPMLERDLASDTEALLRGLRALIEAGRVEELIPVYIGRGKAASQGVTRGDRCFYRLVRESDTRFEWEQTAEHIPRLTVGATGLP